MDPSFNGSYMPPGSHPLNRLPYHSMQGTLTPEQANAGSSLAQQHQQFFPTVLPMQPSALHHTVSFSPTRLGQSQSLSGSGTSLLQTVQPSAVEGQQHQQPMYVIFDQNTASQSLNTYVTPSVSRSGIEIIQREPVHQQHQQQQIQLTTIPHVPGAVAGSPSQEAGRVKPERPMHDVRQWGYAVVDQLHPMLPRVPLPPSVIAEETRGTGRYNNNVVESSTRPCTSQVCLLYAHVGCAAGRECVSFHVKHDYLRLSRAVSQPLCCALHNCFYSHEMISSNCAPAATRQLYCVALDTPQMLAANNSTTPRMVDVSLLHLSMTVGLEAVPIRDGKAVISLRRHVCRLHLEGRCKWTKDCGHVHVCRECVPLVENKEVLDFFDVVPLDNTQDMVQRGWASPELQRFLHSAAVLPMVTQLLRMNRKGAIMALVALRVACVPPQLAKLQELGYARGPWEVTMTEVSPKILPFLVP